MERPDTKLIDPYVNPYMCSNIGQKFKYPPDTLLTHHSKQYPIYLFNKAFLSDNNFLRIH